MNDFHSERRHLKPSVPRNEETMSRETWWPASLWTLAQRDGLWLHMWVWDTKRWGFLLNLELLEGFWQWATLTCQWKSLAGWKCSAGKWPGATELWHEPVHDWAERRTSVERSTQQEGRDTEMWVARTAYSKWWHLSFYYDPKQMQHWNPWTLAHIQIIGFPWINRCSPFTSRTPDCLHKTFLPLSSWNVFTGNSNSKIIAMK